MPHKADRLPLAPRDNEPRDPAPAPAWLSLLAAWAGLIMLVASIVFVFLPGTANPRAELEHSSPFSAADRFLPIPIYGIAVAMFLGLIVIWQMRSVPRPLPRAMLMQRIQAWTGVVLALIGALIIYIDIGVRR